LKWYKYLSSSSKKLRYGYTIKDKGPWRHRSDKEIYEAIKQFGELSIAEFCGLLETPDSTHCNWQNKYRQMIQTEREGALPVDEGRINVFEISYEFE